MNYDVRTRLLARVFVDAQALQVPQDEALAFARGELGGVMLGHALEPLPDGSNVERYVFISRERDRMVALLGGSFDYTVMPVDTTGTNLSDFAGFVKEASRVLALCADKFGRTPYRIALLQEGLLREMPPEEMDGIAHRLLKVPQRAEGKALFEWDWRTASRERRKVGSSEEDINLILSLKRGSGVMSPVRGSRVTFDRVRVDIDVNTSHLDTRGRFDASRIDAFFAHAVEAHAQLAAEADALIGGTK
jgi:hypothetical protein